MPDISDALASEVRNPRGPNALADDCRASVIELEAAVKCAGTERERKQLRRRLKLARDLERWCKSRAGYVKPKKEGKAA